MIKVNLDAKELSIELKKNREYCKKLIKQNPMLKHVVYAVNIPKRSDIMYASDITGKKDDFCGMHILNGDPVRFDNDAHFNSYVDNLGKAFGSVTIYAVHNDNPVHSA